MLQPKIDPMLAKNTPRLPAGDTCPGGCLYEPKWDGFRCIMFHHADGQVDLQSRQGRAMARHFPEIVRLAREHLPAGSVLDGELIIWARGRLNFALLQRRLSAGPRNVLEQVVEFPAHLVLFDVLQVPARPRCAAAAAHATTRVAGAAARRRAAAAGALPADQLDRAGPGVAGDLAGRRRRGPGDQGFRRALPVRQTRLAQAPFCLGGPCSAQRAVCVVAGQSGRCREAAVRDNCRPQRRGGWQYRYYFAERAGHRLGMGDARARWSGSRGDLRLKVVPLRVGMARVR